MTKLINIISHTGGLSRGQAWTAIGNQFFGEGGLRERVYHKHVDEGDVFVSTCFGHTVGGIRAAVRFGGSSAVTDPVSPGLQADKCAAGIRNTQGT